MAFTMPDGIRLTRLELRVRDPAPHLDRYRDILGLEVAQTDGATTTLTLPGAGWTLDLVGDPEAPLRPQPSIGMYHWAWLVPGRAELAAVIRRLHEAGWELDGVADHFVSEAIYLRDAEGNAVEIYRDRPRAEWPFVDGEVAMGADPLDIPSILSTNDRAGPLPEGTVIGHIHMHAPDLGSGEDFYGRRLGFQVMQRTYIGALFLAAGGYHHHVGLNVWARGRNADPGSTGLTAYEWTIDGDAFEGLRSHLEDRGPGDRISLTDPSGVVVNVAGS